MLSIHAGAGGTESCDWADMLMRMYMRWAERRGFKVVLQDLQPGEEAGVSKCSIRIEGLHAYGYAKAERGVHRLVRISPFDSNKRRHTSFCSVDVIAEIEDDDLDMEIPDDDLRIDTYRASGKGGQHVNKTDSAIRITHIPSGIVVECQDERSQHKNRAGALSVLQSKLITARDNEAEAQLSQHRKLLVGSGDRSERIRTYNFPQGRLTDHRINLTLYKLNEIMEGVLQEVIDALSNEFQAEQLLNLDDHS